MYDRSSSTENHNSDELGGAQILGWLELGCWLALVMMPVIYWLQGPSVSHDQFVVRTGLVIVAAVAASGLRIRTILQRNRKSSPLYSTQQQEAPRAAPKKPQE